MTYIRKFMKDLSSGVEVASPPTDLDIKASVANMLRAQYSLNIEPSDIKLVSLGPVVNCDLNSDGTVTVTAHLEYDNYEQETETERDQG